jgi:hypothetical protein
MRMSALDELAAEMVSRSPRVGSSGFGLILGLPLTLVFAFFAEGDLLLRVPVSLLVGTFTILLIGLSAISAIRLSRALVSGLRVEGEIVRAQWTAPGLRPETIEAGTSGMTTGTRRVFHPTGTFEESFQSDSNWARDLTAGTRIALLVQPDSPRVHFDLGPTKDGL